MDLFSFSGHKIHGLKGTGALIIKNKVLLTKQIDGGDQEYALRAGTDNVPGDVSLALATEKIIKGLPANVKHVQEISSYLRAELEKNPEIIVNSPLNCNPFILNFSFKHKKASVITEALSHEEIYVSSVSACNSKGEPVSYVLEAMGKGKEIAMNSIRVSFSSETSMDEVKEFITKLNEIIERTIDR